MILSALGFALMAALVKVAGLRSFPVLQIIAARAFVSLGISWWDTHRKGISPLGTHRGLLFARGLIGFLALMCVYSAVIHLPLAEATILQYTHPIFTLIFALAALSEAVNRSTLLCIALSILGLVVILQPAAGLGGSPALPTYYVFLALLGAAGSGAAYVIVRKLAPLEDSSVIIFYFPLVCLPAALLLGWRDFIMPSTWEWLILVGVGIFTQIGQWGLTKGLALHKAGTVVAFSYVQVPIAAALGLLFFNETLSMTSLLGGSLIILGAWINTKEKA
jgi:drug/metabolite transporter (DMT)-like permease